VLQAIEQGVDLLATGRIVRAKGGIGRMESPNQGAQAKQRRWTGQAVLLTE
jgi:hypothetical protein